MNCHKATQQIPLFVEADLETAEMQQVNLHLEACHACREIAAEFQSSQSSLRAVTAPVFDEAMLTQMRRAVNHEIARPVDRLPVFPRFSPIWNWRLACAAVVMMCVSGFVWYSQFKTKSESAGSSLGKQSAANTCCGTGSVSDLRFDQGRAGGDSGRSRSPYRNRLRVASAKKQIAHELPEMLPVSEGKSEQLIEAAVASPIVALTQPQPESILAAPEPEMLRMEFQTADPNIKIIWLTPKEPTRTNPAADIQ